MNQNEWISTVQWHLAAHLNCSVEDFQRDGLTFVANDKKSAPFLELSTMGHGVIVSASSALLPQLKQLLAGKNNDEAFECPLVYGQSIYYVPDRTPIGSQTLPERFQYELLRDSHVQTLQGISGFEHALAFDSDGTTSTRIVLYAREEEQIVALAGASQEYETMWELGIDVLPAYRGRGLATALIGQLTQILLQDGILPFYCASVTNIGSQRVALRAGFVPCWVSSYSTILNGQSPYPDLAAKLY